MLRTNHPRSSRPTHLAVAATLVAVVGLAACGDDDGGGSDAIDGTIAGRLALVPSAILTSSGMNEVRVGDIDAAAQAAGVERPDRDDHDAVLDFVGAIAGGPTRGGDGGPSPVFVPIPDSVLRSAGSVEEFDDELGWHIGDVAWFVDHVAPPTVVTLYGGDFPEARLSAAMGEPEDGMWSVGPADGEVDLAGRTAARPLGESLRLIGDDDRLVVARTAPIASGVAAVVAGDDDDSTTLAEHMVVGPLAAALDEHGVYGASFFVGGSFAATPPPSADLDAESLEEYLSAALPLAFSGVGVGSLLVDGDPIVVLAYALPTSDAAEETAAAVEALVADGRSLVTGHPWSERFADVEVSTSGSVAVARLTPAEGVPSTIGYQVVLNRDGLAAHR